MLKKEITYTDYAGIERTEAHYFNLNTAELTEMNLSEAGGLQAIIERIVAEKDTVAIASLFKKIIKASYGQRSDDGKYFRKYVADANGNKHMLFDDFEQSAAYPALYMELATDDKAASDFINAVLPKVDQN